MAHVTVDEALRLLPGEHGERFASVFSRGDLEVEIYAPCGHDPQSPHTRDELYVVVSGSGVFLSGDRRCAFSPGDMIHVPAGEAHRFESFSNDLVVWVIFYGPEQHIGS